MNIAEQFEVSPAALSRYAKELGSSNRQVLAEQHTPLRVVDQCTQAMMNTFQRLAVAEWLLPGTGEWTKKSEKLKVCIMELDQGRRRA
jgi:hypothetical protein